MASPKGESPDPMYEMFIRLFESGDQSVHTIREDCEGDVLGDL
jgi:hypothetical protein